MPHVQRFREKVRGGTPSFVEAGYSQWNELGVSDLAAISG